MTDLAVAPPVPADADEERDDAPAYSLTGAGRLLIGSGTGQLALALFVLMLGISAYVLLTYPLQFGRDRWSNPIVWADNPKSVPPSWMRYLGTDVSPQEIVTTGSPSAEVTRGAATVRDYDVAFSVEDGAAPTFLSLTINGVSFSQARPPLITATLTRPDGAVLRLVNFTVAGPRAGETAPYRRYFDTPERILLNQQEQAASSLSAWYGQAYPGIEVPGDLANRLDRALFAYPDPNAPSGLRILSGDYQLKVQFLVPDPTDSLTSLKTVIGGNAFGIMGTDSLGRDLFEGLLYGFPIGLLIAVVVSLFSTLIGASLGILSGYAGGKTDTVIQRLCDILNNVPLLPLLIFLVFILGSHLYLILLFLVLFGWTGLTILVRSMVLQIRSGQLVEAARALGASRGRIMLRHVFPQTAPFIVAQMIFFAPGAILAEASLSFIGLGDPSVPTWGQMLEQGFRTGALYVGYWWWVVPPGILIIFTAVAFMLLALAIEPIVDPRLRQQRT